MGRPVKFDRDHAVKIVMNEIWKHGFEACSVKAISEKLGITRSSFYNAFETREALFIEALDLYFSQSPDRVLTQIDSETRVIPLLTGMFKEVCRARASDPEGRGCMAINSVAELVGVNKPLGPMLEKAVLNSLNRLERLLRQAAATGEIEDGGNLRDKALALQNLLIGVNVLSKVVRSERDLWAASRQTLTGLGLYAEEGDAR